MRNIPSCSIFKRKDGSEAVFTAYVTDEKGYTRKHDTIFIIKLPTSNDIIANTIKKSIEISKLEVHVNSEFHIDRFCEYIKTKSDRIRNREWLSISVYLNEAKEDYITDHWMVKSGYTFDTLKNGVRYKSYPSFHLPLSATDEEIGEAFRKAFDSIDGIVG